MAANEEKRPASVTDDRPASNDRSKAARSERSDPGWSSDDKRTPQRIITRLDVPRTSTESSSSSDERSVAGSGKRPFKRAATTVQRQVAITHMLLDESGVRRRDAGRCPADHRQENTYRMKPDTSFSVGRCQQIVVEVFDEHLAEVVYDPTKCAELTKMLSQTILLRLKALTSLRHKYVCHVIMGKKSYQSMQISSRCVWNALTDSSADARFENNSIFAIGLVYGVYFE